MVLVSNHMNLSLFLKIEDAYDQRNLSLLNDLCKKTEIGPQLFSFFQLLYDSNPLDARIIGEQIFLHLKSQNYERELQGFMLQWIIVCTEMNFDETLRTKWLTEWSSITGWAQSKWCLLIRKYQFALNMYFQSSYRESLTLFEQFKDESISLQYDRGIERAHFHIALIYRNLGLPLKAEESLILASDFAQKRSSMRMIERIGNLDLAIKDSSWSLNQNIKSIENLIKKKKYHAARKLVLYACRVRRIEKRSWGAESEALYLSLVSLAFQNKKRFLIIYKLIKDPIIKERALSLSLAFELKLPKELDGELSFLRQMLGIQGYFQGKSSELFGQRISKINDLNVVNFLKLISENEMGCDKELICQKLWNYNYDPVIHDPKIYKLIFKTKKILGLKDAILSAGGSYKMNQKYSY